MGYLCSSELLPENYPPLRRFFRKPFSADEQGATPSPNRSSKIKHEIQVMSYNVLADQLATTEYHPFVASTVLDFAFRGPRIIQEIKDSEASLICLQEVDHIDDFYNEQLEEIGYRVIYGTRELRVTPGGGENHTIAIAYKAEEWVLIDSEQIDLMEIRKWLPESVDLSAVKNKNALLCILQHQASKRTFVVGNAHLEHSPELDFVKFAQAAYLMEKSSQYIRENLGAADSLPFICCGDFNSLPISSVLSCFYAEDIENAALQNHLSPSLWTIPAKTEPAVKKSYRDINQLVKRKADSGFLDPLIGDLRSAYDEYNLPRGRGRTDHTLTREQTMPEFTHLKATFRGTLDHIFYNQEQLEVTDVLEVPSGQQMLVDKAIPSTLYPSDHFRIEAIFTLK